MLQFEIARYTCGGLWASLASLATPFWTAAHLQALARRHWPNWSQSTTGRNLSTLLSICGRCCPPHPHISPVPTMSMTCSFMRHSRNENMYILLNIFNNVICYMYSAPRDFSVLKIAQHWILPENNTQCTICLNFTRSHIPINTTITFLSTSKVTLSTVFKGMKYCRLGISREN